MKKLIPIFSLLLALTACATTQKKDMFYFDQAPLMGMIYDEDSQPVPGAQVSVDGRKGPMADIRGRFVLPDLSRGSHTITVAKSGFEELTSQIEFLNKSEALYLRMISFGQLLTKAETALNDRKWSDADGYLTRADKLSPQDPVLLYLKAVRSYRTGGYADAESQLTKIIDGGFAEPYVYLFRADVYEKGLNQPERAIQDLTVFLTKRYDADVEKRLADLKARVGQKPAAAPSQPAPAQAPVKSPAASNGTAPASTTPAPAPTTAPSAAAPSPTGKAGQP